MNENRTGNRTISILHRFAGILEVTTSYLGLLPMQPVRIPTTKPAQLQADRRVANNPH